MDGSGLNQAEQRELEQRMNKRQVKEFIGMFNTMVDGCFVPCIDDFTSKALSGRESGCLTRCVAKNFAATGRLSERFGELSQVMQQTQGQQR